MSKLLDALNELMETGKPINDFSEMLFFASDAITGTIGRMADDRFIDDKELDQLIEFFQAFTAACEYERECRQAALEAAGGADVKGDTNLAQKIKATTESATEYVQNLKV